MQPNPADQRWMRLALSLGRRGMGQTWPNPAVGCVIIKDGRVVGRGWTKPGGRPHAETEALLQAGADANGATAYVTLEPCAHVGKSQPCVDALIKSGVARVVSALEDPDPRVAGKGHALLQAAGIDLTRGCLGEIAAEDHAGFLKRITQNLPFVTLKLAASLDGRIATQSGESQWITGPQSRHRVHQMRATHDAIAVGSGTVLADDPMLNVRGMGQRRQPARVVFDSRLSSPPTSQLGQSTDLAPVWLCHGADAPDENSVAWQAVRAKLLDCKTGPDGRLDLKDALEKLATHGVTRLFCEGGGQIAAALLADDLVDQLAVFSAGLALGADGLPGIASLPQRALADCPRLKLVETTALGPDSLTICRKP